MDWPVTCEVGKGLEGAIAAETTVGAVDGQNGVLIYRGYDIADLAEHSSFEETSYLLIYGSLPSEEQLSAFKEKLLKYRSVPESIVTTIRSLPKDSHPMALLRSAVSLLGCLDQDSENGDLEVQREIGIKLISQFATIAGIIARHRKGLEPVEPEGSLSHAAYLLEVMTGEKPNDYFTRTMDVALILHADHGMNASTFTSMVVASTLADMYSAVTGGISALKGSLHGGANERALKQFMNLNSRDEALAFVQDCIAKKKKIMGFGHRVYKVLDPRAKIFREFSKKITHDKGMEKLYEVASTIEEEVVKAYGSKGIYPNVDFYSGTIYYAMGIEPEMFTVLFAVSRISGWVARIMEYLPDNRIFRPKGIYVGPKGLKYEK